MISGKAEEHGKVTGAFIIAPMTDDFSLQVWMHAHYVTFSPSGTTDSSSAFKNATVLH